MPCPTGLQSPRLPRSTRSRRLCSVKAALNALPGLHILDTSQPIFNRASLVSQNKGFQNILLPGSERRVCTLYDRAGNFLVTFFGMFYCNIYVTNLERQKAAQKKSRFRLEAGFISVRPKSFLLRHCARNHEDADAGAEVLGGGGVDLAHGDGVEQGVAALREVQP